MNKVKIKICGIKEIATIDCCIDKNVEYFGLIFFEKSVRNISIEILRLKLINWRETNPVINNHGNNV